MGKLIKLMVGGGVIFLLSSCSVNLDDYEAKDGAFDLKNYFSGDVIAWGTIQNHKDEVTRRFCVELEGTWAGNEGTLAEKFYFDDGEISYRNWQLIKQVDGSYKGFADDVIGYAVGQHKGYAFQLQYTLALKVDDSVYNVAMDDWMFQIDQYRVMNKTAMSKFGVNVANVTLFFDKQAPIKSCE